MGDSDQRVDELREQLAKANAKQAEEIEGFQKILKSCRVAHRELEDLISSREPANSGMSDQSTPQGSSSRNPFGKFVTNTKTLTPSVVAMRALNLLKGTSKNNPVTDSLNFPGGKAKMIEDPSSSPNLLKVVYARQTYWRTVEDMMVALKKLIIEHYEDGIRKDLRIDALSEELRTQTQSYEEYFRLYHDTQNAHNDTQSKLLAQYATEEALRKTLEEAQQVVTQKKKELVESVNLVAAQKNQDLETAKRAFTLEKQELNGQLVAAQNEATQKIEELNRQLVAAVKDANLLREAAAGHTTTIQVLEGEVERTGLERFSYIFTIIEVFSLCCLVAYVILSKLFFPQYAIEAILFGENGTFGESGIDSVENKEHFLNRQNKFVETSGNLKGAGASEVSVN